MEKTEFKLKDYIVIISFALLTLLLMFDSLYHSFRFGINVPLEYMLFQSAVLLVSKERNVKHNTYSIIMLIAGFMLSFAFALFNDFAMLFFDAVGIFLCSSAELCFMFFDKDDIADDMLIAECALSIFVRPFHKMSQSLRGFGKKKSIVYSIIGILIAIPVCILFVDLLSESDKVFKSFMHSIFSIEDVSELIFKIVFFVISFLCASSLAFSYINKTMLKSSVSRDRKEPESYIPVYIVLGSLLFVLLSFSVIQLIYLFIGLKLPNGMTYSEYAREGFYQLCIAAALIYIMYLACSRLTKKAYGKNRFALRIIYTLLMFCNIILCASAFMRIALYESVFHFTTSRLMAQAFVIAVAIIDILAIIKIWKDDFRLMRAVIIALSFCLVFTTYFNMSAFTAKENIKYIDEFNEYDYHYLTCLYEDAVPYYIDYPEVLEHCNYDYIKDEVIYEDRCILEYNFGRVRARKAIEKVKPR